jgi:hypothetical protein
MRGLFFILFLIITSQSIAQSGSFDVFLKKGKAEFEKEYDKRNYDVAISNLEKAAKLKPENAEVHYFLGYAYSRSNFDGANKMMDLNPELVFKSSAQFELVNKLSPLYKGEYIILDPYSKITAEWGSLSMYYWYHNKRDSSIWALDEGKKRGGFSEYFLNLSKMILDKCNNDAMLMSSGDNNTFSLWYLQTKEVYRSDVAVIDGGLLDLIWYTDLLYQSKKIAFDVSKKELDSLYYSEWKDSIYTINGFSWLVKPSYVNQYLTRGDNVYLSILNANQFKRDIYFTYGYDESYLLGLSDYLQAHVVFNKLAVKNEGSISDQDFANEINHLIPLIKKINNNSQQERKSIDCIRYSIVDHIMHFIKVNNIKRAKSLLASFDAYPTLTSIPYIDTNCKEYEKQVRKELSTAE